MDGASPFALQGIFRLLTYVHAALVEGLRLDGSRIVAFIDRFLEDAT